MYFERNKNPSFHNVRRHCVSIHCTDQKQHSNRDFLTKSINNTLQTCVDTANECMQAYNTGAGVKNQFFCSLHYCICAGCTMILITFLLYNYSFRNSNQYFYVALGRNSIGRRQRKWLTARPVFPFMVSLCFYGWSFFLWSFHIRYTVIDNTCYRFFAIFPFALL